MLKFKYFFWSFLNTGGSQLIGFISSIVIARIASADDFGVFAIAAAIIMVANIFADAGLSSTVINDKDFCEDKASTILWLSVFASFMIFLSLSFFSEAIGQWFRSPRIADILPAMSITCIASSAGIIHAALIAKKLQFKKKATLAIIANLIAACVGIYLAFTWTPLAGLTVNYLLAPILLSILMWIFAPWSIKLVCKPNLIYGDIKYCSNIAISSLLDQISRSSIVFFLGQRFNVATVGFFNRADAVKNISSKTIDKVLQRVAFPLLCKVRSNKVDNMYYNHLIMFEFLLLLLLPLTYFMFKFSEEIILLIYGNAWLQSANLLKILVLGGILIPMTSLNLTLLKSNRKTFFLIINKFIGLSLLFVLILSGGDFSIQKILNIFMIIILIQYITSIISLLFLNEFNLKSYFKVLTYMLVVLVITSLLYDNLFHIKNTSILLSLFSNFLIIFVLFISSFFTSKKILKYKTHIHLQPK